MEAEVRVSTDHKMRVIIAQTIEREYDYACEMFKKYRGAHDTWTNLERAMWAWQGVQSLNVETIHRLYDGVGIGMWVSEIAKMREKA